MCVSTCFMRPHAHSAHRVQKRALASLELELTASCEGLHIGVGKDMLMLLAAESFSSLTSPNPDTS